MGINTDYYHLPDRKDAVIAALNKIFIKYELVILSGGVSKGQLDYIPDAMEELGVQKLFHKVSQRPGKPFWFGVKDGKKVVFAFPGNPVSTFLCYHKYLVPWLKRSLGFDKIPTRKAILAEDITIKTKFTYFLQVQTSTDENGRMIAQPIMGRGSGDHANLLSSDAFLELPGEIENYREGEIYDLISFRNPNPLGIIEC